MSSLTTSTTFKSQHNLEPTLLTEISDVILNSLTIKSIKINEDEDFNSLKKKIKNKYRTNKKNEDYASCYEAVNKYTMDMFSGDFKTMMQSQFTDIGDLGNYEQCKGTSGGTYNIMQMNLTNLPIDLRLGLCLPSECTWDMMKKAGEEITTVLSSVVQLLGNKLKIELLQKFNVGIQVYFFQPDARKEEVTDQKTTSASSMAIFIGFLVLLAGGSTLLTTRNPPKNIKRDIPNNDFKKDSIQVMQQQEEDLAREGTAANTMKAKPTNENQELSPGLEEIIERNDENSLFQSDTNILQPRSELEEENIIWRYLKCFSVTESLFSLTKTRRNHLDDPELDVLEAMKAMTVGWGILTTTSLYVLSSSCRNVPVLLEFFKQLVFAFVSSGNFSPDFFFLVICMMSFIKINQLYDFKNGISPRDYIGIYLSRFLKIFPIYYFVFFAGWTILPIISYSTNWFVMDRLFIGCESQWPFILTFINTYFPYFTKALEGCYYWPYVIPHYMMFSLIFPLLVIIYKWNKVAFLSLLGVTQLVGIVILGYIGWTYSLTVGIVSLEDYYLWSYQFNKAHTKLPVVSSGLFAGYLYIRILEYRKATSEEKKKNFKIFHFMHNSKIVTLSLYLYAFTMLVFITGVPRSANADAYSWTRLQNTAYTALGRSAFCSSVLCWLLIIFMGKGGPIKTLLMKKFWIPLGRLTLAAYLIYPIVVGASLNASNQPFFVSYPTMVYAMLSNIIICYLIALPLYIFVQAPAAEVIKTTKNLIFNAKSSNLKGN